MYLIQERLGNLQTKCRWAQMSTNEHKQIECTYEPVMTKAFLHGRTEAIRTVQVLSINFTKASGPNQLPHANVFKYRGLQPFFSTPTERTGERPNDEMIHNPRSQPPFSCSLNQTNWTNRLRVSVPQNGPKDEDDGGISSDEGEANSEGGEELSLPLLSKINTPPSLRSPVPIEQPEPQCPSATTTLTPTTPTASPTAAVALMTPNASKPGSPVLGNLSKILRRPTPLRAVSCEPSTLPPPSISHSSSQSTPIPPSHHHSSSSSPPATGKRKKFRRQSVLVKGWL
jgi:hypothetical protein